MLVPVAITKKSVKARTVTIKVRYSDFTTVTRSHSSPDYTDNADEFAARAGGLMALAAESFNDGLRAYYLSFAVIGWFVSPWAFVLGTLAVLRVLYQREFHSDVLALLRT